ncbi:hypothetical protein V6N13_125572 [Hibiscus sabdariffa]
MDFEPPALTAPLFSSALNSPLLSLGTQIPQKSCSFVISAVQSSSSERHCQSFSGIVLGSGKRWQRAAAWASWDSVDQRPGCFFPSQRRSEDREPLLVASCGPFDDGAMIGVGNGQRNEWNVLAVKHHLSSSEFELVKGDGWMKEIEGCGAETNNGGYYTYYENCGILGRRSWAGGWRPGLRNDHQSLEPGCILGFKVIMRTWRVTGDVDEPFLWSIGRTKYMFISSYDSCKCGGVSTMKCFIIIYGLVLFTGMTISDCWRKLVFLETMVKGKKYKEGEVNVFQQSRFLPDWLSSFLSSYFQTMSLPIGEVTVGEKMWFSPGHICLSLVSGVYESFPLFINNDLLVVHVSCQIFDFPEIVSDHAQLSQLTRTKGGMTNHSRYHFMRVNFLVREKIFFASFL